MNTPWRARAAVGALALSILALVFALGGLSGELYFFLLVGATLPGWPLGFALFGRRHPLGWIAGALLGYALTSFAWWAVVFLNAASTLAFAGVWAATVLVVWAAARGWKPAVAMPEWTPAAGTALALLLLLVPLILAQPFGRLGAHDGAGNRLYRAYFIADFVWHTALTAELAKEAPRPRNPYLALQPVHYYWTYFRVPATLARHGGLDVETSLKLNAIGAALLLVSMVYLTAWTAFPDWPFVVAGAVALTILAPSAEGLAVAVDLIRRGHPLAELRDFNIDSAAAWAFKGLRIDDLPRAMWYTPQHSMAYALGLIAVPVALVSGAATSSSGILLVGFALGASLAFNPLVGAFFCAVYGVAIVIEATRARAGLAAIARHSIAVLPVLAAFGWCTINQVGEGAFSALHFGFWGPARNATVLTFALSFGPLLLPMAVALWPGQGEPLRRARPALIGVVLSVLLMHLVTLTVDQAWVGFRGGHLFFVLAPAIVALGFIRLLQRGFVRTAVALAATVLVTGLPTTIVDAYNAQDVTNFDMSPGDFHFTLSLTPAEQEALAWIRAHTPTDAVVQAEPVVRGRETWSLIPSWAERRMAGGNAIPLLAIPEYAKTSEQVRFIYASDDAKAAWALAKALRIDYLYADATERRAYAGVAKFDAHPE